MSSPTSKHHDMVIIKSFNDKQMTLYKSAGNQQQISGPFVFPIFWAQLDKVRIRAAAYFLIVVWGLWVAGKNPTELYTTLEGIEISATKHLPQFWTSLFNILKYESFKEFRSTREHVPGIKLYRGAWFQSTNIEQTSVKKTLFVASRSQAINKGLFC